MERQKAFTLIELFIVMSIIGLLATIILINMNRTREEARLSKALHFNQHLHNSLGAYSLGVWGFNEGTGTTIHDSSGSGNDFNLAGGAWVDGIQGKAYQFSGGKTVNFEEGIGKGVTYSFWFRLISANDTQGTFLCGEDVSDNSLEDNLGQRDYGDEGCGGSTWRNSQFNVSDTKWHHFVFSKSSNSLLCLDGKCLYLGDAAGYIPNIKRIRFNRDCGCGYGRFNQGFIIDELSIYEEPMKP